MGKTTVVNHFGKLQGWNNVTFNLLGRDVVGITEINYSEQTAYPFEIILRQSILPAIDSATALS